MTREEAQRILASGQGDVSAANKAYYGDTGGGGFYGQAESVKAPAAISGPPPVNLGFTPSYEDYTGYNPTQFATQQTAQDIAKLTGGTVGMTEPTGPVQPPAQRTISYGTPETFNAGLLARQMGRSEDSPWMKEAILRAQLSHSSGGGVTPTYQSPFPQQVQQMGQQLMRPYGAPRAAPPQGQSPMGVQTAGQQSLSRAPSAYGVGAGRLPYQPPPMRRRPAFNFPSRFGTPQQTPGG